MALRIAQGNRGKTQPRAVKKMMRTKCFAFPWRRSKKALLIHEAKRSIGVSGRNRVPKPTARPAEGAKKRKSSNLLPSHLLLGLGNTKSLLLAATAMRNRSATAVQKMAMVSVSKTAV